MGGFEAGGFGQDLDAFIGIKADVGGVVAVVPVGEVGFRLETLGHYAEPAAGFQEVGQFLELFFWMVKMFGGF